MEIFIYRCVKYIKLYEEFNLFKKLNPLTIIKNGIDLIKNFLLWNKESKDHRFQKVREFSNFILENSDKLDEISKLQDIIINKVKEIKKEDTKDYSELKYQLRDELNDTYEEYKLKLEEYIESIVVKYYEKYGTEVSDDLDQIISFLKTSKWFKDTYHLEVLNGFKKILNKSKIKNLLDSIIDSV
jgi:hypothetical protein